MIEDKALALLEKVEGMCDYLLDNEPERMDRKGMVAVYMAAAELRKEFYAKAQALPDADLDTPGKVRSDHPESSKSASLEIAPRSGTQRHQILTWLVDRGSDGGTDEEIQEFLGIAANSERPRRVELVEGGWVLDSGDTRPTAAGLDSIAWKVSSVGRLRLAQGESIQDES